MLALPLAACGDDDQTTTEASDTASQTSTVAESSSGATDSSIGTSEGATTTSSGEPTGTTTDATTSETTGESTGEVEPITYELDWDLSFEGADEMAIGVDSEGAVILLERDYSPIKLSKYTDTGDLVWSQEHPCGNVDADYSFVYDHLSIAPNDSIVIAGHYDGACTIGDVQLPVPDERGLYVAAFDTNGLLLWASGFGGNYEEIGEMVLDSKGDILLAGDFDLTIDLGGGALVSNIGGDNFVAKLAGSDGSNLWSRHIKSSETSWNWARSVTVDNLDNVYALTWANGGLDIDGNLEAGDEWAHWDLLVSYDANGIYRYHRAYPLDGFGASSPNAVVTTSANEPLVFHFVGGNESLTVGGVEYGPMGDEGNLLLIRHDSAGVPLGVSYISDSHNAYDESRALVNAIVLPSGKEILISGQYQKAPTFGPYTLPEATDVGWKDGMYAAVIDLQGNTLWAWGRGDGANDLMIKGVATHDGSAFAITGRFWENLDLGAGPLENPGTFIAYFGRM